MFHSHGEPARRLPDPRPWLAGLIGGTLVALLVLLVGAGPRRAPAERVVRAQRFELVDSTGTLRAVLAVDAGATTLSLRDREGRERVALVDDPGQSGLFLFDEQHVGRIGVAQFARGGGGVALHGPEARGAAVLYYKDGGSLTFYDASGRVLKRFAAEPEPRGETPQ